MFKFYLFYENHGIEEDKFVNSLCMYMHFIFSKTYIII